METYSATCFSPGEEQEYSRLKHAVEVSIGRFALILVRGNYPPQRNAILNRLETELKSDGVVLQKLDFSSSVVSSIIDVLAPLLSDAGSVSERFALALTGLEASIDMSPGSKIVPDLLSSLNVQRDTISEKFQFPLILWLTDHAMDLLSRRAPDFKDFFGAIFSFRCEPQKPNSDMLSFSITPGSDIVNIDSDGFKDYLLRERIDILQDKIAELEKEIQEGKPGLDIVLADTYRQLGTLYANDEYPDKMHAIQYLKRSLSINNEHNPDKSILAELNYKLGRANYLSANYPTAIQYFEDACDIYTSTNNQDGRAKCLFGLATLEISLSHFDSAKMRLEDVLAFYKDTNDLPNYANCLKALAKVYVDLNDLNASKDLIKKALDIFYKIDSKDHIASSLLILGFIHRKQGELTEAIERYNEALQIYKDEGSNYGLAACHNCIGITLMIQSNLDGALAHLKEAQILFRTIGNRHDEARNLSALGDVFCLLGNKQDAFTHLNMALSIVLDIGDKTGEKHIRQQLDALNEM